MSEETKGGVTLEEEGAILSEAPPLPPLVLHRGFWFDSELVKSIELVQAQLVPRPDDVILATFPKSGTTWLKALAFAVTNRSRYTKLSDHPLLTLHPQDVVPSLETPFRQVRPLAADLDAIISSPRLIATHLPLSLVPTSVASAGCRFVYLCRDPKDVFVSMLHFTNKISDKLSVQLGPSFRLLCEGVSVYGPIWNHYLWSTGTTAR